MISFRANVDLAGLRRIKLRFKERANRIVQNGVRVAGDYAVRVARTAYFKDRTGELRRTIRFESPTWRGAYFVGVLVAPMQYASYVELGTKAHDIWPKAAYGAKTSTLKAGQTRRARGKGPHEYVVGRGIALRWKDTGGEIRFARVVHHRGTAPYPFMQPAADAAASYLITNLRAGFASLTLT